MAFFYLENIAMIEITWNKNTARLTGEQMSPEIIFNCGQAFRFLYDEKKRAYGGVAHGRQVWCREIENGMELFPVTPKQVEEIWRGYFDLDFCYPPTGAAFAGDKVLQSAVKSCPGLRLLRQEPFETLITFIISANNNIGRIRGIVERICAQAGEEIAPGVFAFPTPKALAALGEERLRALGAGYRAKYLNETAKKVASGYDFAPLYHLNYLAARKELCAFSGVGPKVADCILLFAFGKRGAFPADVWIRRMLLELYGFAPKNDREILSFAAEHFGEYGGIAQQYLFHYMRTMAGRAEQNENPA